MPTNRCKQCLRPIALQALPNYEHSCDGHQRPTTPHREQTNPTTPSSPENPASFPLLQLPHTSSVPTDCSTPDLESLRERLGKLPQELYDEILLFTLRCDAGKETFPSATQNGTPVINAQLISQAYTPPVQLALNRQIRRDTLQKYYSSTTFIFPDHGLLTRWMRSLSSEAMTEIQEARVVEATASCIFTGIYTRPESLVGKHGDGEDIWRTWDLSIETRQSSIGKNMRAQELVGVAGDWSRWH